MPGLSAVLPQKAKGISLKTQLIFDRLTGQLFGDGEAKPLVTRRVILTYFAVALGLVLLQVFRRFDALTNPQFWAEDGAVIFRNTVVFSFRERIFSTIYGFPYLLPKLVGQFAKPFGYEAAPLVYNLAAEVIVGLLIATFSLPHFKHIINSDRLRIVFCLLVVCLPNSLELVGVAINLGWYSGLWAILVSFMWRPASWWGTALLAAVHFILIFSSPASIIVAPIWLVRLVRGGLHRDRKGIALALAVLASIASLVGLTGDLGSAEAGGRGSFSLAAAFNFLTTRVVGEALVGTQGVNNLRTVFGAQVVILLTLLALAALVALSWAARFKNALLAVTFLGIMLVYLVFTLVGRLGMNPLGENLQTLALGVGGRYFFIGNALVFLVGLLSLDRLDPTRFKLELTMAALAGMVWVVSQTFVITIYQDYNWPQYATQIDAAVKANDKPPLVVPINPPGFGILFNFDQQGNQDIKQENYLTELQEGITYAQTFTANCDGLNSVSLYMATYKRPKHNPVSLELTDTTTGKVVTQQSLPANTIKDETWQKINFLPASGSFNHTYRLSVSSPGTPPGQGVTVYVSNSDKYPPGTGFLNDKAIPGDLVFRYTCRLPLKIF